MRCPRCGVDLKNAAGAGLCPQCGGAFLAGPAADTVKLAVDDAMNHVAALADQHATRRMNGEPPARCPVCAASMARFRVGAVDVDTCMEHGSWYDRGELALVRDALLARATAAPSFDPSAPSGLELEERPVHRPPRPGTSTGLGAVAIEPSVQDKINSLARFESREEARARRHHGRRERVLERDVEQGNTLGVIFDVLDLLT
jgi:Zn-finger nucleic acid-binding protein